MSAEDGDDGSNQEPGASSLFEGKQFWLSHNIPQRSRFKELIMQHGGIVRLQEKDAGVKLVDHAKKNLPKDTYSYKYVEDSIRNKKLANLENYRAGPSSHRPVGATYIPSRGVKILYSLEDDQKLWDWMQQFEGKPGIPISGNKIYQDLAAKNPRHTWQSYRDRYLKRLRGRPRPGGMAGSAITRDSDGGPGSSEPQPPRDQTGVVRSRRQSPAATAATSRASIAHEDRTDRTSSRTPATTEERTEQRTEPSINKPDDRKRKRSPITEPADRPQSREVVSPEQKRRRPPEATTQEPQAPETTQSVETTDHRKEQGKEQEQEQPSQPKNEADSLFLELPFFPATPTPEPEEEEGSQPDIDDWIDDRVRSGRAQSDAQVIEALRYTSMDPSLADKVLGRLVAGKGIPDDMPGVWTSEDDKCLEGANARDIERVLEKHGTDYFNARWEYLGLARDAGLENPDDQ